MKQQLSECKMERVWNFGFSSILSAFFFERVLGLSPRVDIAPHRVRDPAQLCWANFMWRLGGWRVDIPYQTDLFLWWQRQIVFIDDYPYVGIDFLGDPYMPLSLGATYGDIGNETQLTFIFWVIIFFCIFWYMKSKDMFLVWWHIVILCHVYVDVGP